MSPEHTESRPSHPSPDPGIRGKGQVKGSSRDTTKPGAGSDLSVFFHPGSIAVIGATPKKGKLGNILLRNLMDGNREIYPVNPKYQNIEGLEAYSCVLDIPDKADLAVISIKACHVPVEVRKCAQAGVKGIVVISSGFSELGDEGKELEQDISDALAGTAIRLLGPNTLGYFAPYHGLDAMFLEKDTFDRPGKGGIALISQSGSLGVDFMETLSAMGSGLSVFAGLGNKLDIDEGDLIGYLAHDPNTRCIALYLEDVRDGQRFFEVCRALTGKKPIILLKGGRSSKGGKAASLHTGSMGGEYRVLKGIMDQLGIIEARDEVELTDMALALSELPEPRGDRGLIITNGGGNGIVAVDLIESQWQGAVKVVEPGPDFGRELGRILPEYISPGNPLDLTAEGGSGEYVEALELAAERDLVDFVILGITVSERIDGSMVEPVRRISSRYNLPVITYVKGGKQDIIRAFNSAHIPTYPSVRRAVNAAGAFIEWHIRGGGE